MDRFLMDELVLWKNRKNRKPLILNGARQVGKTWLLKQFGKVHFEKVCYASLDNDETACSFFEKGFDTKRILSNFSLHTGVEISPHDTLIIIDEIQSCPKAITSLKYFCEESPEFGVVAAGSLLGLSANEASGYPVGKVNTLNLYPLSFREFLDATGNQPLRELLDSDDKDSIDAFSEKATRLLKEYYVVGGMPEAVLAYSEGESFRCVREIQSRILEGYMRDFSKHVPVRLFARMVEVWNSIPTHLSRENKKFVFGHVRKGARSKDFEETLAWLASAGLIQRVDRVTKPNIPLSAYCDNKSYKVFLVDIGLLGAMCGLDPSVVLKHNDLFTEFKGAMTEQYVCQQLVSEIKTRPFYWSAENSIGEIDFLIQTKGKIFAIEVKAEENLRSKSLRAFKEKYPEVDAVRLSLSGFRRQNWMQNIPLFAIGGSFN